MIVTCTMIRIPRGRWCRIRLIAAHDAARTTITETLMTSAVESLVVTASAEQMPRICSVIGLLSINGSSRTRRASFRGC